MGRIRTASAIPVCPARLLLWRWTGGDLLALVLRLTGTGVRTPDTGPGSTLIPTVASVTQLTAQPSATVALVGELAPLNLASLVCPEIIYPAVIRPAGSRGSAGPSLRAMRGQGILGLLLRMFVV